MSDLSLWSSILRLINTLSLKGMQLNKIMGIEIAYAASMGRLRPLPLLRSRIGLFLLCIPTYDGNRGLERLEKVG